MKNWKASVSKTWLLIQYLQFPSTFTPFLLLFPGTLLFLSSLSHCGWLISVLQSLVHNVGASFGFLSLVIIHSFVGDWCYNLLVIGSSYWAGDWWWCSSLIHSFLITSTRLISVLQSLVHHVGASIGGFFRWWLIYSFEGDWCYNL